MKQGAGGFVLAEVKERQARSFKKGEKGKEISEGVNVFVAMG